MDFIANRQIPAAPLLIDYGILLPRVPELASLALPPWALLRSRFAALLHSCISRAYPFSVLSKMTSSKKTNLDKLGLKPARAG